MSFDTCGLLVNNVPQSLDQDSINAIFSMYGINKVVAIDLPTEIESSDKNLKSYLVIYSSKVEASAAMQKLNRILPFQFHISPFPPSTARFDNSSVSHTADSSMSCGCREDTREFSSDSISGAQVPRTSSCDSISGAQVPRTSSCDSISGAQVPRTSSCDFVKDTVIEGDKSIEGEGVSLKEEIDVGDKHGSEENYNYMKMISESSMPKVLIVDINSRKSRQSLDDTYTVYQVPLDEDCPVELNDAGQSTEQSDLIEDNLSQVNERGESSALEIQDNTTSEQIQYPRFNDTTTSTGCTSGMSTLERRARSPGVRVNLNSKYFYERDAAQEKNSTMSLQDFKKLRARQYSNLKQMNGRQVYQCDFCDSHFTYFKYMKEHIKESHLERGGRRPGRRTTVNKKPARARSDESILGEMDGKRRKRNLSESPNKKKLNLLMPPPSIKNIDGPDNAFNKTEIIVDLIPAAKRVRVGKFTF